MRPEGEAVRVELGPSAEIEELVGDFRARLLGDVEAGGTGSASVGARLRARVWAPVESRRGEPGSGDSVPNDSDPAASVSSVRAEKILVGDLAGIDGQIGEKRIEFVRHSLLKH